MILSVYQQISGKTKQCARLAWYFYWPIFHVLLSFHCSKIVQIRLYLNSDLQVLECLLRNSAYINNSGYHLLVI